MKSRWLLVLLWMVLSGVLFLSIGCRAEVKSEDALVRYAIANYGDCKLVESTVEDRKLSCRFRDGQYGFEYTVTSAVTDVGMDGAKFYESEDTYDDFLICLTNYALEQDSRFRQLETDDHTTFEVLAGSHELVVMELPSGDAAAAQQAGTKAAAILREYERDRVYESYSVAVYDGDTFLGKCGIHDGLWITPQQENEKFFTEKARNLNRSAVFVRAEEKTFGDMGLPLSEVNNPIWDLEQITDNNSPVTCYYFEADGREFLIADFYVKKSDDGTGGFYTDYFEN